MLFRLYYKINGVFQLVDQAEKMEDLPTPNGPIGMEWKITSGKGEEEEQEGAVGLGPLLEVKEVKLGDNPFLLSLTDPGMAYQGYSADTIIGIAACKGNSRDWAAYFATPDMPFPNIVHFGNKLPEQTAKELFPRWAKSDLKWRL